MIAYDYDCCLKVAAIDLSHAALRQTTIEDIIGALAGRVIAIFAIVVTR
jgi:hypothetical protein